MKKTVVFVLLLAILGVPQVAATGARAQEVKESFIVGLVSQEQSKIGEVTVEQDDNDASHTLVTVTLSSYQGSKYSASYNSGSCNSSTDLRYTLSDVVSGSSVTLLSEEYQTVTTGDWHISLSRASGTGPLTACADKKDAIEFPLADDPETAKFATYLFPLNKSGVTGAAEFYVAEGSTTRVEVGISVGPGEFYEAIVRSGTCQAPGSVTYTLNSVQDGRSSTVLKVPIETFASLDWHVAILFPQGTEQSDKGFTAACADLEVPPVGGMPSTNGPIYAPPPPNVPTGMPVAGTSEHVHLALIVATIALGILALGGALVIRRRSV
jgi:hypothetical protein